MIGKSLAFFGGVNAPAEEEETTAICLRNCYGEYTIISKNTDMALGDIVDLLVVPLLLAAGYAQENIDEIINPR